MAKVLRRFTMDSSSIFFINHGIISKKSILDFIKENEDAYAMLDGVQDNVGWCTPGMCLMFTDYDKIFRVDSDMIINIMLDPETLTHASMQQDIVLLEYDSDKYSDESITVDDRYKEFLMQNKRYTEMCLVPDRNMIEGITLCYIIHDPLSIYEIKGNLVIKTNVIDYIAFHENNWKEILMANKNAGYILNADDAALRVTHDKVERISRSKSDLILRHSSTRYDVKTSSAYEYLVVAYENSVFPDDKLIAAQDYKL